LNIQSVKIVSFSPTGNSRKIAESIAKAIQTPIEYVDLTPPSARTQDFEEFHNELAIIATPVYAGRIPNEAAFRIRKLKANCTPAVVVVTYGNRAYEDALIELSDIVSEVGFGPIAAGAFIGEHSWSFPEMPTAHGRPDAEDLEKAERFGKKIKEKYERAEDIKDISPVTGNGKHPYTLHMRGQLRWYNFGELTSPSTNEEVCIKCGKCAEVCPTGAVTIKYVGSNPSPSLGLSILVVSTDEDTCIWCCACVKNCPSGARVMSKRMLRSQENRWKRGPERKEPETFL
jgi:ferredoxin